MRRLFIDVSGETCPRRGSKRLLEAFQKSIRRAGLERKVEVIPRGCFGLCKLAANLYIEPEKVWYSHVTLKDVPVIVRRHLKEGRLVQRLIYYPERLAAVQKRKRRISCA